MKRLLLLTLVLLLAPLLAQAQSTLSTTTCPGAGCVVAPVGGQSSVAIQITGTFVGTLQFEQSSDGTNYDVLALYPNRSPLGQTATTAPGLWNGTILSARARVRFSAFTSGTALVTIVASPSTYVPAAPIVFTCVVPVSTAVVITAVGAPCTAPGAGLSLHLTDILFSSSASGVAADAFPTLKSGTGGTCGTATTVVWGALSAAALIVSEHLEKPIKLTANHELCWITTTAGSKFLVLGGFIAP
jgi:hypothetical protein